MTQGGEAKMPALKNQHLPSRPSLQTHHSSSVPSTPFQRPRDIRFQSRSPSPSRGLSNQSPRSVASEAPGAPATKRHHVANICRFETGAERRKRRIPYVEGGEKELRPPKKEPKKVLEPDEHEKLSGDMRELYDRLLPSDESEERRALLVKKLERLLNEEWPGNDIRVNVFGSSGNLLSSSDSDVDICITTPPKKQMSMHDIAALLHKNGMPEPNCRATAKVPIVKCWDTELKLACDLNVNNPMALENTRMIKTYVQMDDRIRPLAKIIKYWTKRRILNDASFGGTISSYTWICMILNFLQRRDPPIIPSLQKTEGHRLTNERGEKSQFADDLAALKGYGSANKETLPELLFNFFRHYGYEFNYSEEVVSVKEGEALSRKDKGWDVSNYQNKESRHRLCVEEPFTMGRNLGNSADEYAWSGIHREIRRAFDLLADGAQLEKCCEEFEFPPEEKPIFQKPVPKPKPTLTRSASQSGRPNPEQSSSRSRKTNRNQSAQRAGNRRASSGATFNGNGNRGPPLFQSPPIGSNPMMDYFAASAKGDLHNQLYQQYQFLQAQQEALRSQLVQHQHQAQAHNHAQGRAGDLAGSPQYRPTPNGLPSPRMLDNPPQTAPLLPGYLYHYPARYPLPSPMAQARTREGGTSTNPSSPSLVAAVPALRRQVHRASVTEGANGSLRSQSQPGRSLPHPLTLQQHAHPGFDVSGAMSGAYHALRSSSQGYPQAIPGMPMPQMPFAPAQLSAQQAQMPHTETALPKEYIGYYVGQSPSLIPQFANAGQMQMPPMTLRDPPPQRQRRVTPDLMPPLPNGKHSSRSPSPLGHQRATSTVSELPLRPLDLRPIPPYQPMDPPPLSAPAAPDPGGPLIVNGSTPTPSHTLKQPKSVNGLRSHVQPSLDKPLPTGQGLDLTRMHSMPINEVHDVSRLHSMPYRPNLDTVLSPERSEGRDWTPTSPAIVSTPRFKQGPKLNLSPNGTPHNVNGIGENFTESPSMAGPLLSPVAELRTPSPTHPVAFEKDSPQVNGLVKAANIANAKQAEHHLPVSAPKHERTGSAPNPSIMTNKPANNSTVQAAPAPKLTPATNANQDASSSSLKNPWQQVPGKKGHKKAKSSSNGQKGSSNLNGNGQPMPANEMERKGG